MTGLVIGLVLLFAGIIGAVSSSEERERINSVGKKNIDEIKSYEKLLDSELISLSKFVKNCKKCKNKTMHLSNLINEDELVIICGGCNRNVTLKKSNTFYEISSIPEVFDIVNNKILPLINENSFLYKELMIAWTQRYPAGITYRKNEAIEKILGELKYDYYVRKYTSSTKMCSLRITFSRITFQAEGSAIDEHNILLERKKQEKINPLRPALDVDVEKEWNYKRITTGKKGDIIKRWAKTTNLKCPDGSKCGGVKFSTLKNDEINFGHIIPQSYAKEFPHFSDKVHHPDNLYLSCRSCNISLSDSFPYKELKDRIKDENGTIGDWIRLQKITI